MWLLIFLIIIVSLMVGAPILLNASSKDKKMKDNALQNYIDFINKNGISNSQSISLKNIARIDIETQKKLLGAYSYYESESVVLKFEQILDFEIFENGNSVVSSKTGSAIVGGLLFGGLGAIAGASGSRIISDNCKTLKLNIYTTDVTNSVVTLDLLDKGIEKNSTEYENLKDTINKMIGFLKIARESNRQAERKEDKKVIVENIEDINQNNILRKLKELAQLKEQGIINDKEFEESKKKILSKI